MFCGAGSFAHDDDDSPQSPPTPRGSRRKQGGGNPYAARGLPEFSMVLADLESRREKIMAKAGQGVDFVRFVSSNSQDWVPIVVRRREGRPPEAEEKAEEGGGEEAQKKADVTEEHRAPPAARPAEEAATKAAPVGEGAIGRGGALLELFRWRDSYYWPAVAVLILLSLALFGRVFAICCTSMWWYLAPAMRAGDGGQSTARKPAVKRDYARRTSDRRLGGGAGDHEGAAGKRGAVAVDCPASPQRHHASGKSRG